MTLVNRSILHCTDMKKFSKNVLLRNCRSEFGIISQNCSLCDPFQNLFTKFRSVNKDGISEWGLLALYKHIAILVNSSLKATKKLAMVISKIQVSHPWPSWPSCFIFILFYSIIQYLSHSVQSLWHVQLQSTEQVRPYLKHL